MRIIGGQFKGRKFNPPAKNWPTRPTTDIAKEGLFNILSNRIDFAECQFLDLFGGTGSHCYECISRGCTHATYVDKFPGCVKFVSEIAELLKINDKIIITKMDVFKFIKTTSQNYNYIFAGPPYPLSNIPEIPDLIFKYKILKKGGFFVLEHNPDHNFAHHIYFKEARHYGTTIFSFFEWHKEETEDH